MKELLLSKKGKKNKGKYFALVDDDVFEEVNKYNWTYQSQGYARNGKINIQLHRYIWNLKFGDIPEGLEVEHIDRNPLNCQISNLRLATRSENQCNRRKYKNNTSGHKGICKWFDERKKKDGSTYIYERWYVQIKKDEERYSKTFPYTDEGFEQAQKWYKEMSLKLHKEFSIYDD